MAGAPATLPPRSSVERALYSRLTFAVYEAPVSMFTRSSARRGDILPILSVLGLERADEIADWSHLNGPQYAMLNDRKAVRLVLHLLGVALFGLLYFEQVSLTVLTVWAALTIACAVDSFMIDSRLADVKSRGLTSFEFARHSANALAKGLLWTVPAFMFAPHANAAISGVAWSFVAMMALAAAVSRHSAPLGSVLFCSLVSLGWTVGLALEGSGYLALVAVLTGLFSILGTIEGAKATYQARVAEIGMDEKNQVVSLLLREYEDSDADWLFQLDKNRRLHSVSPRLAYALRRDLSELEGTSFIKLISGNNWETGKFPPSLHQLAEKLKERESFSNLVVEVYVGGERRWWELSGTPMLDENGSYAGFRGVGSDVTAQQESSEKIAFLARYDTLTELPNRLMLHEALGDALRYAEKWRSRCALMMIDLDRFKAVNDSLGHQVGDRLLAEVARRLKGLMGEGQMCGRLGGDEFAVVIRDATEKTQIERLAGSIIDPSFRTLQDQRSPALCRGQRGLCNRPTRRSHGRGPDAQCRSRPLPVQGSRRRRTLRIRARRSTPRHRNGGNWNCPCAMPW